MKFLRRLGRDRRGVAAVEFALIAPIMCLLYFGMAEYGQSQMAYRKAVRTAASIGDLVAQSTTTSVSGAGGITDIFALAPTLMKPFPTGSALKLCLASIVADNDGVKKVVWTENQNDSTCPAVGTTMASVSSDLLPPNQSVIMSRVTYKYTSPVNFALVLNPTFTKTAYLRPRRSVKVDCADC